ncbi:unnamed protein product [Kuraishia capsulata CBS 1993]|uniref:Calcofluor white hypersensitive protein n=1 Tax=Kuraishia capsulata CBS 1993 TaxID=1382522 RepID=W6MN26_9ASCO|nr:uncharacterized protein KUCA_T00002404001 [Kuraishia capsulata CBS 1993]CDK26432.1 unnamed protein product [Kuraishia capsulata CBS 1993]
MPWPHQHIIPAQLHLQQLTYYPNISSPKKAQNPPIMAAATTKPLIRFSAVVVAWAHTVCALSAFLAALVIGCVLHYEKIVKNEHFGYPDEWFPSVSATIGDRYPERSIFQIIIALTAGPRFLLLFLSYLRLYRPTGVTSIVSLVTGFIRTVTCGGWVYITSSDDHDAHDIFMISYIVLTIPWTVTVTLLTSDKKLRSKRKYTALVFFGMLVPLVYLFIQHKVHRVAGAYSYYAYVEWSLIFLDIGFDAWTIVDFKDLVIELLGTETGIEFNTVTEKPLEKPQLLKPAFKRNAANQLSYTAIIVNTINSFVFWSVLTALFVCVWFFPLWDMGISGFELVVASVFSPVFLVIPQFRHILGQYPQVSRLVSVWAGIGSYMVAEPSTRLLVISLGAFAGSISLANELWYLPRDLIPGYSATFMVGLLLSTIAKFAFWTNNPVWPILNRDTGGANFGGLLVGTLAALATSIPESHPEKHSRPSQSLVLSSLGFAGLLFSLLAMLTDSSTIILWVWSGYPVTGPIPVPHGVLTMLAMAVGTFIGLLKPRLVAGWKFFSFGAVGAIVLYEFHGWTGYAGGWCYALWLSAISPVIFGNSARFNPGLVFGLGFFWFILIVLAHVWIVAYAFVPMGWLLRERTDIVLGTSVVMIACGFRSAEKYVIPEIEAKSEPKEEAKAALFATFIWKIFNVLTVLVALSCMIAAHRFPFHKPQPYHPEEKLMTCGIWTIHFGLDNDMWASEHRMRDLIKDLELDVVGLLESDTQRILMGNRDLTQRIGEELGMYVDFGPGPNKHTWGCALLSKFPIVNSTHHLLPSPVGELAPAIHATLNVYGEYVDIVVFHSGQEEDVEDRRLQSLGVRDIMGSTDRPTVLLSYLVTEPLQGNYNTYVSEESGMHDIDPSDDDRWCEYILYKKLKRTGYARISRGTITDTELQVGKFQIGSSIDETYSQTEVDEDKVAEGLRFPAIFHGEGVREHHFHVFNRPKYFE